MVAAFVRWQPRQGCAVSTVKTDAKLALKAGTPDGCAYALIRAVAGISHTEAQRWKTDERWPSVPPATPTGRPIRWA